MSTTKDQAADANGSITAFLNGSLRKELGLESNDLKAGLAIAKNYLERGAPLEAMRTYVALVLCEPTNADFQVGLANCAIQMSENHLALQAASAVVAMAPSDPRGYLLPRRACLALGHYAEAEEDFRDAVEFGRKSQDAFIVDEATKLLQTLPTQPS